MADKSSKVPAYKPGDTIRVEIRASDESGVASVEAYFYTKSSNVSAGFALQGEANGETEATVVLQKTVDESDVPGEYECQYLTLTDTLGNKNVDAFPKVSFRIENVPGDREGPKIEAVRIVDLTGDEKRLLTALRSRQSSTMKLELETLAQAVAVVDYQRVADSLVSNGYALTNVDEDGDQWMEITQKGRDKLHEVLMRDEPTH